MGNKFGDTVYKYENAANAVIFAFFVICFFMTESFVTDTYITQALDQNIAVMVENEIENYEEETGNKVELIASRTHEHARNAYSECLVNYRYTATHPALYDVWSQGQYVNYINGTDYECREMSDDEYDKIFPKHDYHAFDLDKQLVFEGNTLYWVVY